MAAIVGLFSFFFYSNCLFVLSPAIVGEEGGGQGQGPAGLNNGLVVGLALLGKIPDPFAEGWTSYKHVD
jgi:hypothetical protein